MNYGVNAQRVGIEKLADVHGLEKEAILAAMKQGARRLARLGKSAPSTGSITKHDWSKAVQAHPSRAGAANLSKTVNVTVPPMRQTLRQQMSA